MSDRPMLCVLVDAFRHDYLRPDLAPNLHELADSAASARMRPILGYSDAIRATIFTGAYPDEHGYWMEYCYRPEASPLGGLRALAPLDRFPSDFAKRALKVVLARSAVRRIAAREGYEELSIRHFPFRSMGQFDWTLRTRMTGDGALGMPTLFDELSAAGIGWRYLDASKLGSRGVLDALDRLEDDTRLTFVYLHQIDMASHLLGIESRLFRRTVRKVDALTAEVVARHRARMGDADLVVFSDHGMSPVEEIVSLPDLWTHPAFPDRFCFALDATMVRLWFHDHDERLHEEIRSRVAARAPRGRFLEPGELADLHLDFDGRLYGDEVYLLEPRVAIFPNFHSMLRPKAMHAYHPDDPEQQGIYVETGREEIDDVVELVEVGRACDRRLGIRAGELVAHGD